MSSTINVSQFIKKHPLKYDSEKVMDVAYGKEYEENHLTTTYKSTETIRTDTRLKKLYHTIMDEAISEGATDIQIADWGEYGLVRFRLGSEMKPYRILHKYAVESLIVVFRDKAGTNPESRRTSNIDGTVEYVFNDVKYDTRLAFSPTIRGSMVDIRILYPNRMDFQIDDLGMADKVSFAYKEAIKSTEGLILVSGPTGSGKTTTEFTGIRQILLDSEFTKNIMTVENPVEYRMEGVIQSSVNPLQGYTFPVALRTILRQDPNVILVGEINDTETATTAIRAASSGHLVFSTVHANNVLEVSNALNQLGVSDRELGNAMRLILYQTLKDKLCPHCRQHKILRPEQKQWMDSKLLGQPAQAVYFSPNPEGCEHCNYKGYKGRIMLVEMLETNYIYRMLREEHGRHIDGLRNALLESEDAVFYPLEYDVYRHLKEGNISFEDATGMVGK